MKKTCPGCNGKGEVDVIDYRSPVEQPPEDLNMSDEEKEEIESARMEAAVAEASKRKVLFYRLFFGLGSAVATVFLFGFIGPWCVRLSADNKKANAAKDKWFDEMGYVVVQYDASKHVTRCWITPHTSRSNWNIPENIEPALPFVSRDFAWVEVPDRNGDLRGFAANIGVTDVDKCVR